MGTTKMDYNRRLVTYGNETHAEVRATNDAGQFAWFSCPGSGHGADNFIRAEDAAYAAGFRPIPALAGHAPWSAISSAE